MQAQLAQSCRCSLRRRERSLHVAPDAPLPRDEVHAARDLEAEGVRVLGRGVEEDVEVREEERVERRRAAVSFKHEHERVNEKGTRRRGEGETYSEPRNQRSVPSRTLRLAIASLYLSSSAGRSMCTP